MVICQLNDRISVLIFIYISIKLRDPIVYSYLYISKIYIIIDLAFFLASFLYSSQ
jgi:hypothetical protein